MNQLKIILKEIKTACLWKKIVFVYTRFLPVRLNSDPWIIQPTEHYEELNIEEIVSKQKKRAK